jgi:hypothetical protein
MEKILLEVLAAESNFAVVKMEGRSFPGVLIQGDSLSSILNSLHFALENLDRDKREAIEEIKSAHQELAWRLNAYEAALKRHGSRLPYSRE